MERDLRRIRQKRIERDRANGIGLGASPPKEPDDVILAETEIPEENMLIDDAGDNPEVIHLAADAAVEPATAESVAPVADSTAPEISYTDKQTPKNANQEIVIDEEGMPQDSADSMGLAITMTPEVKSHVQERSKDPDDKLTEPAAVVSAEDSLEVPEAVDIDFDSMFNDPDLTGAEDALNFDFGLSTDPAIGQEILNESSFANSNMSNANNADLTNVPLNANEDIEGVLPGLGSYLNADTDFSNISIPAAATLAQTSQAPTVPTEQVAPTTGAPAQDPVDPATAEASFDDFFGDFDMGGTDDLGDGTLGDLDDFDWS